MTFLYPFQNAQQYPVVGRIFAKGIKNVKKTKV